MNNLSKNECELKTRLEMDNEKEQLITKAIDLGFQKISDCLQTDYTVDKSSNECKKNGLILRFRHVEPIYGIKYESHNHSPYIITLKIKKENNMVQDNIEYECISSEKDSKTFSIINQYLVSYTQCNISSIDFNVSLHKLVKELYDIGLNHCRMLSQKKRVEYRRETTSLCFDCFPEPVGKYMEIEAQTPEAVYQIINELQVPLERFGKLNYGKLIQASLAEANIPSAYCRVCLFDNSLREKIIQTLY